MILIATVPCHSLPFTHYNLNLVLFLFWSIKALSEFQKEHNVAGYTESLACSPILVYID